jgi:hypothetical protein
MGRSLTPAARVCLQTFLVSRAVSRFLLYMQVLIVIFVVAGIVIGITKTV